MVPGLPSCTLPSSCHSPGLGSGQSALLRPYFLILSNLQSQQPGSTAFPEPFTFGGHTGPCPPKGKHLTLGAKVLRTAGISAPQDTTILQGRPLPTKFLPPECYHWGTAVIVCQSPAWGWLRSPLTSLPPLPLALYISLNFLKTILTRLLHLGHVTSDT